MYMYTLTDAQLEEHYTRGAHRMIENLHDEGYLTAEQAAKLIATKQLILRKKSFLTRAWKKLFGGEDEDLLLVATIEDIRPKQECKENG